MEYDILVKIFMTMEEASPVAFVFVQVQSINMGNLPSEGSLSW